MMEYAEESLLPEDFEVEFESAESGHVSASAGTFSLRRARYFSDAGYEALLSADQQSALMNLIRENDCEAKQEVIVHNLRLVADIAKGYTNRGVAFPDLIREGSLGLIHALENFEVEGGFRFSTYAARCIRHNIERAIMDQNIPRSSRSPHIPHAASSQA